jgi:hypothetical protein
MAATYTLPALNVAFSSSKSMISLFNGSGSGRVLRVYRVWALNNQITAVTGVLTNLELRKISASSGGTALTTTKHDSNSTTLSTITQILPATNATVTLGTMYRRVIWSTDEPATGTLTLDEFQCFLPLCCIWSMGYADTTTDPITLREGEGLTLMNFGGASGQADFFFEFTSV